MPEGEGGNDRPTIVVQIEGKEHTVQLPAGWLHEDAVKVDYLPKEQFAQEVEKRARAKVKGMVKPEDLLGDEAHLRRMLELEENKPKAYEILGLEPGKPGKEVDVAELRRKVEADLSARLAEAELKPRDEKIKLLEELVGHLRERDFRAEFMTAAADVRLNDEMIEPLAAYFRQQFRFDADENGWFKVGEDGELELSLKPEPGGSRHVTVAHVLEEARRGGKHGTWFKAPAGGSGYRPGKAGGKRHTTLEEFKAMGDVERRRLREEDLEQWRELLNQEADEKSRQLYATR